jgi:hypothetical protein
MSLDPSMLVTLAFDEFEESTTKSNISTPQLIADGMPENEACCCFFAAMALMENTLIYLTALEYKDSYRPDVGPCIQSEVVKYLEKHMPNIAFPLSLLIPSDLEKGVVKECLVLKGLGSIIEVYPTLLECYCRLQEPRTIIFSTAIVKNQMSPKPRWNRFVFQEPFLLWSFGLTGSEPATAETVKQYTLASSVVGVVCGSTVTACSKFFGRPPKTQWA